MSSETPPSPPEECPLTNLLRSYLRLVTACPQAAAAQQQQLLLQQQQQRPLVAEPVRPLPKGAIVQCLGEMSKEVVQTLRAAVTSASTPTSSLTTAACSSSSSTSPSSRRCPPPLPDKPWWCQSGSSDYDWLQTQAIIQFQAGNASFPCRSSSTSSMKPDQLKIDQIVPSTSQLPSNFISLPIQQPSPSIAAVQSSPIEHTDIYKDTMFRCGLTLSSSRSLAPTNVLTLLRQREQCFSSPCAPRLAPTPQATLTNLSMRRVPDFMRQAHHYESRVFSAQFSHSGDALAVATQDQHIRLYEVREGGAGLTSCCYLGKEDGQVGLRLFDSREEDESQPAADDSIENENDYLTHGTAWSSSYTPTSPDGPSGWPCFKDIHARGVGWSVVDTHFSSDDRFLIYSTWSPKIQLISCNVGDLHVPLDLQPGVKRFCAFSARFSPCDNFVLAGCSDRQLYLYDITAQQRIAAVPAHCADINAVSWISDCGAIIASGSDDCLIKLWDRRCLSSCRPTPIGVLVGHSQGVASLCAKGDGRHLLSNGKDQKAKLWDIRHCCQPKDAVSRSSNESSWDYRWAKFQPQTAPPPQTSTSTATTSPTPDPSAPCKVALAARAAACSLLSALMPNGCSSSSTSSTPASTTLVPSTTTASTPTAIPSDPFSTSSSSATGSTLAIEPCPKTPCNSGKDLSLMSYSGHRVLETLIRAHFSPLHTTGQRYIYSGSQTGVIHIWDMLTGEVIKKLSGHAGTVRDVSWHPKESILVSSSWDCSVARWECGSNEERTELIDSTY